MTKWGDGSGTCPSALIKYHVGVSILMFLFAREKKTAVMYMYYNPWPMNLKQELKFNDYRSPMRCSLGAVQEALYR